VVYIVPPEKRAFGAGNSVFSNGSGSEAVRTDPKFPPSVNNFAYHISLETPPDGHNDASSHSGYSREQYQSLAWLIARTSVPENRITTHQAIDRSGSRIDPRNFNAQQFLTFLRAYPNRNPAAATRLDIQPDNPA
jgi:N-acetyl-anhydromuramyl-L-alanine amidase AmpD